MVTSKIKSEILNQIFSVLDKNSVKVILFGSHASGQNNNFSDIDIGLTTNKKLDLDRAISEIRSKLMESNIPYKIDLVNLDRANAEFKEIALKGHEIWHAPK